MHYIDANTATQLYDWSSLVLALKDAHAFDTEHVDDLMLNNHDGDHFFIRAAWQNNRYAGAKMCTIFPQNSAKNDLPAIQAVYILFDGQTGSPLCFIDGTVLTKLKTASDSALGSLLLSSEDITSMLMVGAGGMSSALIAAHCAIRSSISTIKIWNRSPARCENIIKTLAKQGIIVEQVNELEKAVSQADLICCATATQTPIINGNWLKPGSHLDLVGAFTKQMRETDDVALKRGRLFVDSRRMTVTVVGELMIPLASGAINLDDIQADFYELCRNQNPGRKSDDEITVFKNGGGGHLDLMIAIILYHGYLEMLSI